MSHDSAPLPELDSVAPRLRPVIETLKRLEDLPENWDSHGARPVHRNTILKSLEILGEITRDDTPVPYVFPTPAGGVQFEWHTSEIDLEVEVTPDSRVLAYCEGPDANDPLNEWERDVTDDLSPLVVPLARLSHTP